MSAGCRGMQRPLLPNLAGLLHLLCLAAPKCQSREEPGDGCGPAAKRRREEFEDVLPLLEIEKVQDLSHDARSEWAWGTDEGLVALHTSLNGCNAGRKYCLQVWIRETSVCGVAGASAEPLIRFFPFQVTVADLKKMNEHVFDDDGNPETTFSARQLTFEVTDTVLCQHVRRACAYAC